MQTTVKKNFLYNLAYQVLVMLVPLVTAPYIARVLGAENIGIYEYTVSISAYFILFGTIGTSLYGQRQIAFYQGDKKAYSKAFWEIFLLRMAGMVLMSAAFFVAYVGRPNEYHRFYLVLVFELLGSAIDVSWFFQGLEQFKITVLRNTIVKLVSVVSIFLFVKKPEDLILYFVIYVLSIVLGNLSLWFNMPTYVCRVPWKELTFKVHMGPIFKLFIPQIAVQIYTIFDKTMLGYLIVNKSEVGYYGQAQKLIKTVIALVTALGTVMLPRIANKYSEGDMEGIKEHLYKSFEIVTMIALPLVFGICVVAKSFVPWYYSEAFMPVVGILQISVPIIFFIGMSNVIGIQFLLPTKKETHYTLSVLFGAGVNFLMNLCLIPKYGAIGASIGTVMAEATVMLVQVYFTRRDWNYGKVFWSLLPYFAAAGIMFGLCYMIEYYMGTGLSTMVVQVLAGGTTYILTLGGIFFLRKRGHLLTKGE